MKLRKSASLLVALFLFVGCGGSSGTGDEATPSVTTPGQMEVEDLIRTEAFSGTLVVHFDDALAVRTDKALALVSLTGQDAKLSLVVSVLSAHPAVTVARYVNQPEEVVEAQRVKLERLSGKQMPDWNSVYRLKVADPEEAVAVMTELRGQPGVKYVYPEFRPYPASLDTTPSLVGWQAYLNSEATAGGLDAQAAWAAGVHGAGVIVVDHEEGLNFGHEDLGLTAIDYLDDPSGSYIAQPDCAPGFPDAVADCPSWIAHGTAVAGILVAQDNGHGVTGFAPQAKYLSASMLDGVTAELAGSTDGVDDAVTTLDDDIEPGSIWIIEVGLPGKYSSGSCSSLSADGQYGCVPVELWPSSFDAIAQATAYGVTVVEGGGNGSISLDDPNLYTGSWSFAKNMATEDAGAIMVGASQGENEQKISFSNCGARFNAFAWGQGVATTGYPLAPYAWNGTTAPVPPNSDTNTYFVNNFGGTSSASAMVGGAAVLVQSHARAALGHRRYLMPLKMREILTGTGVAQADSGCNIGMQPRIDQAMAQVDAFLATVNASYPELATDAQLTEARMISLRALGVGIICKVRDPEHSDPSCPEEELWPTGEKLAKTYDVDGDDRADLVKFENGEWNVDLSSVGEGGDNFGAWDLTLTFPAIAGKWVWPYVEDLNSDGRADFVAYDKEHGKFYVALTTTEMLRTEAWPGWDWILDYSSQWHDDLKLDPAASNYSRPVIGNFHRTETFDLDLWNDIAIICSDGRVRIDYGAGTAASFSGYENEPQLIPDSLLAAAPGWAYLPVIGDFNGDTSVNIGFKVPDGLGDEGRVYLSGFDGEFHVQENDWFASAPHIYGGNDKVAFGGVFAPSSYTVVGLKDGDSRWRLSNDTFDTLSEPAPANVYGDEQCHPTIGDYDGDGVDDRVVMCPEEWRIVYSGDVFADLEDVQGVRHVDLGYDKTIFSVPGRAYYGGISYAYTQQVIELFQKMHPGTPPPILVDMVTVSSH